MAFLIAASLLTVVVIGAILLRDEEVHQIIINGDDKLQDAADRHDWTGNGSPEDPFMISTNIHAENDRPCISISNTSLHIIIKDCDLMHRSTEGDKLSFGLLLDNVTNVSIIGNSVSGGRAGLMMKSSSNTSMVGNIFGGMGSSLITSVFDCRFENNVFNTTEGSGLEMRNCDRNAFYSNSFKGNVLGAGGTRGWVGLVLSRSSNNTFFADRMNGGGYMGIGMSVIDSNDNRFDEVHFDGRIGMYMNRASSNDLSLSVFGDNVATALEMIDSDTNRFVGNSMTGNYTSTGIKSTSCSANLFERNAIGVRSAAGYAVHASGSNGNALFRNNFYYLGTEVRTIALAFDDTGTNDWNGSEGGNHWGDWTSPDDNLDGIVDQPYLLDGPAGALDAMPLTALIIFSASDAP